MKPSYPPTAVSLGTLVRSKKLNRLGVVTSATLDKENVHHYTCFFIPNTEPGMYFRNLMKHTNDEVHGVMIEESEFDLVFYLMMGTVDLDELDIFYIPGDLVL
jgi:hypothetical protein